MTTAKITILIEVNGQGIKMERPIPAEELGPDHPFLPNLLRAELFNSFHSVTTAFERHSLQVAYPDSPPRILSEQWVNLLQLIHKDGERRLSLRPPNWQRGEANWRAELYPADHPGSPWTIPGNNPVGLGKTPVVAVENLLRFVEGKDPIDG